MFEEFVELKRVMREQRREVVGTAETVNLQLLKTSSSDDVRM